MSLFQHTYFRLLRNGGVHQDMVTGQQTWRSTHYAGMVYSIRFAWLKHDLVLINFVHVLLSFFVCLWL
jgi:hypothetical protein